MATTTTNIGLTKPAYADDADIAVINGNMDILDTKIGAVGNTDLQSQVTTLNSNVAILNGGVPTQELTGDLNNVLTPGTYLVNNNCTNKPPLLSGGKLVVECGNSSNYIRQTYYGGYNIDIYTRTRYWANNGWMWNSWKEVTNENLTYTKEITHVYSIEANSTVNWNPRNDDGFSVTGYTPIGIVGYKTNNFDAVPMHISVNNENYGMLLRNIKASAITNASMTYVVLYIKS